MTLNKNDSAMVHLGNNRVALWAGMIVKALHGQTYLGYNEIGRELEKAKDTKQRMCSFVTKVCATPLRAAH